MWGHKPPEHEAYQQHQQRQGQCRKLEHGTKLWLLRIQPAERKHEWVG
jgi:hypothetical protein